MIAEVDSDYNVAVYLEPKEVEELEEGTLSGELLHSKYRLHSGSLTFEAGHDQPALSMTTKGKQEVGSWELGITEDVYQEVLDSSSAEFDYREFDFEVYDLGEAEKWIRDHAEYLKEVSTGERNLSPKEEEAFTAPGSQALFAR